LKTACWKGVSSSGVWGVRILSGSIQDARREPVFYIGEIPFLFLRRIQRRGFLSEAPPGKAIKRRLLFPRQQRLRRTERSLSLPLLFPLRPLWEPPPADVSLPFPRLPLFWATSLLCSARRDPDFADDLGLSPGPSAASPSEGGPSFFPSQMIAPWVEDP